ncbi:hypothetical protein P43SY_003703 [Pythium insidiosum]|uniref:DUF4360 domain-containing protein n=1 Tax=Pythium insidiosum TaxID=114742 RepID=A0AAD5M0A0_PYTIN|nr:hypothetical protein P43SY_003703 [Pythium insidiosum]KAJ0402278.1 hypothetical protein ATCC90586_005105 [Pythium insidiosum]
MALLQTIFATLLAASATLSAAQPTADLPFKLGTPTFFGSGCPADSVVVVPSTDGQTVSVLFSQYQAATKDDQVRERKTCNLAVPVDIKPGISIGVFKVDYRGNVFVPNQKDYRAQFDAEYFFANARGPTVKQVYQRGTSKDLYISNDIGVGAVVWSPCGASTNFRINTALTAQKPAGQRGENVQISMDSIDATVERGFRYYIVTRKCP